MDWSDFLAVEFWALVTMATILASAVATLVGFVQRRRSRPEADWVIRPLVVHRPSEARGRHTLVGELTNVGDGYAFKVGATGHHCDAVLHGEPVRQEFPGFTGTGTYHPKVPFVPLVEPGQEGRIEVACQVDDWDRAEIVIEWTRQPTRQGKRRTQRLVLRDVRPAPEPEPDQATGAG